MKNLVLLLACFASFSASALEYVCGSETIVLKTSLFSGKVTSIGDAKVSQLSEFATADETFGNERQSLERHHDTRLVAAAFAEDYRVFKKDPNLGFQSPRIGSSRGFFEKAESAFLIRITPKPTWCWWDGCYSSRNVYLCNRK
jgi:hypothetical protein